MTTPVELGEKLKNFRNNAGLSCKAVADMLGIDKSLYSRYEKGERFPDGKRLYQLAKIFNTSVDALVSLPLKNTVLYPSGLLDDLQETIKTSELCLDDTYTTIRHKYEVLKEISDKVLYFRNEALDFPDLGLNLAEHVGETVKVVTLDVRGEALIDRSLKLQLQLLNQMMGTKTIE